MRMAESMHHGGFMTQYFKRFRSSSILFALGVSILSPMLAGLMLAGTASAQNTSLAGVPLNVIETPHFRVVFPPALERYARRVGAAAEAVREGVIGVAGADPGRTMLVLNSDGDITNGFSLASPRSSITLLTSFPRVGDFGMQWQDWLRLLISHEFTHSAHLSKAKRNFGLLGNAIGEGNSSANIAPPWFVEGFATHAETKLSSGGRGRDASVLTERAQAALGGKFPSYGEISSGRYLETGNQYTYGVGFVQFLLDKYGATTARKVIDEYEKQLLPWDFSDAWEGVTGSRLQPLYNDWTQLELARAKADLERYNNMGLRNGSSLKEGFGRRISSDWRDAANNRQLVFAGGRTVYVSDDSDVGKARVLTKLPLSADRVSWAKDGSIVYSRPTPNGASNPSEVFRFRNGSEERLSVGAHARDAIADGDCILYVKDFLETSSLHSICAGQDTEVLAAPEGWHFAQPAPGADSIALTVWRPGGFLDIATINRESKQLEFVTSDFAQDGWPAWKPDGTLIWSSDRNGSFQIFGRDGQNAKQMTAAAGGAYLSSINASGRTLFSSFASESFELRSLDELPEGNAVPLERAEPKGFSDADTQKGLEYTLASYSPSLDPVAWSPLILDGSAIGLGAALKGEDGAKLLAYSLFAGFANVSDRLGLGAGLSFSYDPTPTFGINLTGLVGWVKPTATSFDFGYAIRPSLRIIGAFELFGSVTNWGIGPYALLNDQNLDAGLGATLSTTRSDPFGYALSGWNLSGSASARGIYSAGFQIAGAPLWEIPFVLSVNASTGNIRAGTAGSIELASRFSIDLGLRPNGFMLERLTFQPFLAVNNIGFGGVYGGGLRILTDVVAFYYVPTGIGLEVGYFYSADPAVLGGFKFGLVFPR
jgi:WD40-like Beta Propeller Repeat